MVVRKQCPQVYWSQTDNEVNLYVDLLLDDMVQNCIQDVIIILSFGF